MYCYVCAKGMRSDSPDTCLMKICHVRFETVRGCDVQAVFAHRSCFISTIRPEVDQDDPSGCYLCKPSSLPYNDSDCELDINTVKSEYVQTWDVHNTCFKKSMHPDMQHLFHIANEDDEGTVRYDDCPKR